MAFKLYHGCSMQHKDDILKEVIIGRRGFHMTPNIDIAKEYGSVVICFEVEDFDCHVGTIDKTGVPENDIKSGIEYVLITDHHRVSFYRALIDLYEVTI